VFLKRATCLRESWIGVSTTLYEGFGIYYIEWMAAGTVPITFSNIGTRSLICDSKAGVLAENISELGCLMYTKRFIYKGYIFKE